MPRNYRKKSLASPRRRSHEQRTGESSATRRRGEGAEGVRRGGPAAPELQIPPSRGRASETKWHVAK